MGGEMSALLAYLPDAQQGEVVGLAVQVSLAVDLTTKTRQAPGGPVWIPSTSVGGTAEELKPARAK